MNVQRHKVALVTSSKAVAKESVWSLGPEDKGILDGQTVVRLGMFALFLDTVMPLKKTLPSPKSKPSINNTGPAACPSQNEPKVLELQTIAGKNTTEPQGGGVELKCRRLPESTTMFFFFCFYYY